METWINDVLWVADIVEPEDDKQLEIYKKLMDCKGMTFKDIFVDDSAEPVVALEVLRLFILHAIVSEYHKWHYYREIKICILVLYV